MSAADLLLLFVVGSFVGFVSETIFCYCVRRRIVSRRGMLYGPFSQMYGFGALLMTVALTPLAETSYVLLFVGSGLLGGLFEAFCSFFQESFFGSVSWNYSTQRFALFGGRTSLLFMFFWGVMGFLYVGFLQPALLSLFALIPFMTKQVLASALLVLLGADLILSCFALQRWKERHKGQIGGASAGFFDLRFPDGRMAQIYPDMRFKA